jgi:NADH dehydrogenase
MRTIAVVGGTGFLGRHVVAALEKAGYSVRALSRRNGFDGLRPDPDSLRGADAVVNLAGIKREERGQTFEAVHVDLVRNLVVAMGIAGVSRIVHISVVVARPAPDLPYHDTKWKGEEIVRSSGLDYTILRPGVIYGEGDDMLSHLSLMIRTAPIFPIVGKGSSPMRPVDVRDVASAVLAALQKPCSGETYDIVGPDRLELRDVVRRVAEALSLPVSIWPTPVALMRGPVCVMEAVMKQPLSTRAQLAMLVEGLDGDPGPARRGLELRTAPFTAERIRPLLAKTNPQEITRTQFWSLLLFTLSALTFVFGVMTDKWTGMTLAMGSALAGAMFMPSIRRRLKPSLFRIVTGLGAGVALYGISLLGLAGLSLMWPGWEASARILYAWREGHSPLFIGSTLVMIVLAEEVLWRGVVARYLMERHGRALGIVFAAAIYALAHGATFNPVLLLAALGCGLYWGALYAATDDLVTPTISHLVWDILLLFLFPVVS